MSGILILSILLRLLALALCVALYRRIRDWRMVFLAATLALMALRQSLTQWREFESWRIGWFTHTQELLGLAVSVLALLAVVFLARFLAEKATTERKLRASLGRLRAVTTDLTTTEERERRRLASSLHDGIGQDLAVLLMRLKEIRNKTESAAFPPAIDEMLELLEGTRHKIHTLTLDLSPPILHDLGLVTAVEWLAAKTCEEHCLEFAFEDDGRPKPLDETATVLLFRGAGELVMNVVKHAGAGQVTLSTRRIDDQLHLTVEDDGDGFDASDLFSVEGEVRFGLFSIRERLSHLGGRLEIGSEPGRGTRASLIVPLAVSAESASGETPKPPG